ncbi:hypothetical protein IC607_01090 [Cellulomonas sp. JH27-2]|nr:hypothetical protein [Cellulomonas sp. JH27-2]
MMDDLLQEMINPAPAQHDRPRRRRLWATVAIVGMAAIGVTSLTTSALFSDRERTGGTITTGTLDLGVDQSLTFNMPVGNMLPGARVYAPVTITNDGSLAFEYSAKVTADPVASGNPDPDLGNGDTPGTGDLTSQLHLDLYKVSSAACNDTRVSAGTLLGSSPGAWGIGTNQQLFGSTTPGDATNLTVSAKAKSYLCVRVGFSEDAGNTFQNTAAKITLTFDAVQQTGFTDGSNPANG